MHGSSWAPAQPPCAPSLPPASLTLTFGGVMPCATISITLWKDTGYAGSSPTAAPPAPAPAGPAGPAVEPVRTLGTAPGATGAAAVEEEEPKALEALGLWRGCRDEGEVPAGCAERDAGGLWESAGRHG